MAKKRATVSAKDRARVARTVSTRISDLRRSGLTQRAIADRFGVSRETVRRWERGTQVPDRRTRERVYGAWRRSEKRLGKEGARVDLTPYFRRLWFGEGGVQSPLAFRPVPRYTFPNSAAVVATYRLDAEWIDAGGQVSDAVVVNVSVGPNQDLGAAVEASFIDWANKAQRSFTQLIKVQMVAVVLRWLKA